MAKNAEDELTKLMKKNGWLNLAIQVDKIEAGDLIDIKVEGGWMKMAAPSPGITVKTRESEAEIFVPFNLIPSAGIGHKSLTEIVNVLEPADLERLRDLALRKLGRIDDPEI